VKDFIDTWVFFCGIVGGEKRARRMIAFHILFLFLSFDAREAAYMNRVIIPEEKVRIRTSGIHLLVVFL
jgi:hypothetical protein